VSTSSWFGQCAVWQETLQERGYILFIAGRLPQSGRTVSDRLSAESQHVTSALLGFHAANFGIPLRTVAKADGSRRMVATRIPTPPLV